MRIFCKLIAGAFLIATVSFALLSDSYAQNDTSPQQTTAADYVLQAGDVLAIIVYGEEDLSREYRIDIHGKISIPLIGDIIAAGRSTPQLQDEITHKLQNGFLVNPSVSVDIAKFRPFYIMGEVRSPGSYEYSNDLSVLNAVALAGGFTYRANRKDVELERNNAHNETTKFDDVPVNASIKPGDVIIVKERFF